MKLVGFSDVIFTVRSPSATRVIVPVIERAAEFIPVVRPMHGTTSAAVTGEPSEKWWPALRAIVHEPSPLCVALSASSPTTVPVSSIVKSFSPTPWLTSAQPCWSVPGRRSRQTLPTGRRAASGVGTLGDRRERLAVRPGLVDDHVGLLEGRVERGGVARELVARDLGAREVHLLVRLVRRHVGVHAAGVVDEDVLERRHGDRGRAPLRRSAGEDDLRHGDRVDVLLLGDERVARVPRLGGAERRLGLGRLAEEVAPELDPLGRRQRRGVGRRRLADHLGAVRLRHVVRRVGVPLRRVDVVGRRDDRLDLGVRHLGDVGVTRRHVRRRAAVLELLGEARRSGERRRHLDVVDDVKLLEERVGDRLGERHLLERHAEVRVLRAEVGRRLGARVEDVLLVAVVEMRLDLHDVVAQVLVRELRGRRRTLEAALARGREKEVDHDVGSARAIGRTARERAVNGVRVACSGRGMRAQARARLWVGHHAW